MRPRSRKTAAIAVVALIAACAGDPGDDPGNERANSDNGAQPDEEASGETDTYDLTFASYAGESAHQTQAFLWWADEVSERSDGAIEVDTYLDGSLVGAEEMLSAVSSGRADIVYATVFYHHAELPLASVTELPFVTSNGDAQVRAFQELFEENELFRSEFEAANVRLLYPGITDVNIVATEQPFGQLGDLQGLDIRSGGQTSFAVQEIGANPVSVPGNEIYEAVQRGVVDGYTSFTIPFIQSYGLTEITEHVTDAGLGMYGLIMVLMNQDVYESMPPELQTVIDEVSVAAIDEGTSQVVGATESACRELRDHGAEISLLPQDEREEWASRVRQPLIDQWIADREDDGIDGQAFFDDYIERLEAHEGQSDYISPTQACAEGH